MRKKAQERLIVVSNRLPFKITRRNDKPEMTERDAGLATALKTYLDANAGQYPAAVHWIGSADFSEKTWNEVSNQDLSHLPFKAEPIFFDSKTYTKYYNGFCTSTLWPLFHYFPSRVEFDKESFRCYEAINRSFAERILTMLRPDDIVWIHDYHLMLVPGMVRKQRPDAKIGFFLHIPFPSYEVFRLLHRSWKEKIVKGLLGADLIGFHTHEYVQHFLKTVRMVKGLDHKFRSIFLANRVVKAEMFPMGIDFAKLNNAIALPEVVAHVNVIRRNFSDKKIIFTVDKLDYTKGVANRLTAFERFLDLYPEWRGKVVFILIVIPSPKPNAKHKERKKLVEEEIGRINGTYATLQWQPVVYRYDHPSFADLAALYHTADVALITPLRDGMNLIAKEYVASKKESGVLILSELAGAACELSEAILVNPMDQDEVAQAILSALVMSPEQQKAKIDVLQKRLKEYTVTHWINDFLKQLEEIKLVQEKQRTRYLSERAVKTIASSFSRARKRLLLLDYDGTLVPYSKFPQLAAPDTHLIELLKVIGADAKTDVAIISGRESKSLDEWFGQLPITLVSEYGAGMRLKNRDWQYNVDADQSWKPVLRGMLETFCQRTPGSFIEEKRFTLVWHYRNVESELGFLRSRELLDNLHHIIHNSQLRIIDGNKVIEIRISGIDKCAIAKKLVDADDYSFIMAIGDDKTDEDVFKTLPPNAYTIKIGSGRTPAQYYLNDHIDVLRLLSELVDENVLVNL